MVNLSKLKRKSSPNVASVGIRIDQETKDWLDKFCEINDISVSSLVAELIRNFKSTEDAK